MTEGRSVAITEEQAKCFADDGVLFFPAFLRADEIDELKEDTDALLSARDAGSPMAPYELPRLRSLIWHRAVLAVLDQLIGPEYAFHHIHAARHDAGTEGVAWHHDYLQFPQTNRTHAMVHAFFYLSGLNGEVGDLAVVPGSHRSIMRGDALSFMGSQPLPGEVVFDDAPPGTMILAHSGVLHTRRARPGGERHPRYFVDTSYCQLGPQWPSYGDDWASMLTFLGSHRTPADGRPSLFDPSQFISVRQAWALDGESVGSIITESHRWTR